ncbi:MAG: hypothetical protein ABMA00_16015, partial [Gemmatimonas sp.]
MKVFRSVAAISAALALTVGSAQAQMINFTTTGMFSGTGCSATGGVALVSSWCDAAGGIRITYTFAEMQVLNSFGNAQFGSFATSGNGPATFNDVLFQLTVNQTLPTPGSAMASAPVSGTVSAIQGGLVWAPVSPVDFFIDAARYHLSTDLLTGGVRIDPPNIGGAMGNPQTSRG